jgi:hypothetical protein
MWGRYNWNYLSLRIDLKNKAYIELVSNDRVFDMRGLPITTEAADPTLYSLLNPIITLVSDSGARCFLHWQRPRLLQGPGPIVADMRVEQQMPSGRGAGFAVSETLQMLRGRQTTKSKSSWEFDVGWAREGVIWLKVTNVSGSSPTLDVSVEMSMNRWDWTPVMDNGAPLRFPQITGDAWLCLPLKPPFGNWIRLVLEVGGGSPSFTPSAWFTGKS